MNVAHTPLEGVKSLKVKLVIIIGAAVGVTIFVFWSGIKLGLWPGIAGVISGLVALGVVFWLARGLTRPLRDMAVAVQMISGGDFTVNVSGESRRDEIGALARSFSRMASDLGENDRIRRDLVANVSHELRTPITALQVHLENLIDGVVETDPETLATMLEQTTRLGRLVAQLLDLSRLEAGVVPLDVESFEVKTMVDRAVRQAQMQRSDVSIVAEIDPVDLRVVADPERLHQVVANLLENALRYSPNRDVVEVNVTKYHDLVMFEVLDNGPGIAPEEAEQVFERFYRADAARTSKDGGAGLGLSIARWIVDLHGGTIDAEPRNPSGCRVTFAIPSA